MQQWECHARWFRFIALAVLAIIIPASAAAQERCQDGEIVLNSATSSVRDLGSCIWYLEDPEHAVDFNDILSGDTAPFTRHEGGVLNFGYTESAYWARFDVEVGAGAALTDWILELALPLVDEVVLYLVQDGELIEQRRAGYEGDWSGRDLAVPNPTFRLSLEPGSSTRIYLRITNTNTFRLPITLWHPDAYIEKV